MDNPVLNHEAFSAMVGIGIYYYNRQIPLYRIHTAVSSLCLRFGAVSSSETRNKVHSFAILPFVCVVGGGDSGSPLCRRATFFLVVVYPFT